MNKDILEPPAANGQPLFNAVLKQQPADFKVDEALDIDFSGNGEHLYLQLEKTAMNTDEVVSMLQSCFEVTSADIGLSGIKDRHSVSSQWFSVRTTLDAAAFAQSIATLDAEQQALWGESGGYLKSVRVLRNERHAKKLRRGAHRCNHFVIRLHQVQSLASAEVDVNLQQALEERVSTIVEQGFPNYIGPQRFGQNGQNLQRAMQWFAKPRKRTSRQQRSVWLSAARSALFNEVCAARVHAGSWNSLLAGEPAMLDGSSSFFATDVADREALTQRLREFDIHPSAPWWGRGRSPAQGACAEFEAVQLQAYAKLCEGLERAGLTQERRALRAVASDFTATWSGDDCVELSFSLKPGVFATTLLRECCRWVEPER